MRVRENDAVELERRRRRLVGGLAFGPWGRGAELVVDRDGVRVGKGLFTTREG